MINQSNHIPPLKITYLSKLNTALSFQAKRRKSQLLLQSFEPFALLTHPSFPGHQSLLSFAY